jgi:hypothetical protein
MKTPPMAALQTYYCDPIKMRLSDTMAVLATSCRSAHEILCTDSPVLSAIYRHIPARPQFPAEFTQGSDHRTVHKSGVMDHENSKGMLLSSRREGIIKTKIYLATAHGLNVIEGSDGTWRGEVQLQDQRVQCVAVDSNLKERVYCGTFENGVYRSDNAGASWRPCKGLPNQNVTALATADSGDAGRPALLYAGTEPSAIYQSSDGGDTWDPLPGLLCLTSAGEWSFPPRPETHPVRQILSDLCFPGDCTWPSKPEPCFAAKTVESPCVTASQKAPRTRISLRHTGARRAASTRRQATAISRASMMATPGAA